MSVSELQRALDACAENGGGRVTVPPGEHTVGTLRIRDRTQLYLSEGAVLKMSSDWSDFPNPVSDNWNTDQAPRHSARSLIYADGARGISIAGPGKIDCEGRKYCEPDPNPGRINLLRLKDREHTIPRVILFACCEDFSLSDFTLQDAPAGWSVWLTGCSRGTVDRVSLLSDRELPNADGLHINCSRDIAVRNCHFLTGDDSLILRAFTAPHRENPVCENIRVSDCELSGNSSAVRIGWAGDGEIRNCSLSGLDIHDAVNGIVCQLPFFSERPSDVGEGLTKIHDIRVENSVLRNVFFEPVHLSVSEGVRAKIYGLSFSHLVSRSRRKIRISGNTDSMIRNLTFSDCAFSCGVAPDTPFRIPEQYWNEHTFDGHPLLQYAEGIRFLNTELNLCEEVQP